MKSLTDSYILNNGVQIPCVGFGTWQTPDGDVAVASVKTALACGYRHIDTAAAYQNEGSVGLAVAQSGVARGDIFLTTKVPNNVRGYDETVKLVEQSLGYLRTDYIDLLLIHWPAPKMFRGNWQKANAETWRAMEDLLKQGKIRAIGLSNFLPHHMDELLKTQTIKPMVNQIRLCPGDTHMPTIDYCKEHGILLEAYSPLGTGALLGLPALAELAGKKNKTPAQILIRWSLQSGFLPLPKSVTKERIISNTDVFDFTLSNEEMALVGSLSVEGLAFRDPDDRPF